MVSSSSTGTEIEHRLAEYDDNAEYDDDLELRLNQIGKIFDIPRILNEPRGKPKIINYYENINFFYRAHSWEGFFHYGMSYDGKNKRDDFKEQARIVERYIHDIDAKKVLELASGLGPNMAFLARRNPYVTFEGVDLSLKPLKRYAKIPNAHFQLGDYHDLSDFANNAYDLVFAIDTLCYSNDKLQVLHEVKKKLKRGGLFIIIDWYQKDRVISLSQSEDIMWKLVEKGFSADKFESVKNVEGHMQEVYSITFAKDVSQCVLPSMLRLESLLRIYFNHPAFAMAVNKLVPFDIVKTAIGELFLSTSIKRQIGCYYIHVLKNDK